MGDLEVALEVIQEYIDEFLFEPDLHWPEYEFSKRSSERWAAYELMYHLKQHWNEAPAVDLIIRFIGKMDLYSELNEDSLPSYCFITARETANDILYLFL